MKNRTILTVALLLLSCTLGFAQKITVSGYITDIDSSEPIIGAAVIDKESGLGAITGNSGFYSLSLDGGKKTLVVSYLGYEDRTEIVDLSRNITLDIGIKPSDAQLAGAVVTATRNVSGAGSTQMSAIEVPVNQIKAIPAIGGEVDVIKALQLLPGVQSGSEGQAGLYVRGGGADENLLLMDGVPLYNVNHMFGFFSVFNADAIKNVTLYKGSFPARFGGHLSSVVDVRMNDGNDSEYHGNFTIGLISSKINVEGPIVKGKTTFNISARRTYLDLIARPAMWYANKKNNKDSNNYSKMNGGYDFYDINTKLTHRFSNGDRLSFSFYTGDDRADAKEDTRHTGNVSFIVPSTGEDKPTKINESNTDMYKVNWCWGNMVSSLRWNHAVTQKLYMSAVANYTQYRSKLGMDMSENVKREKEGKVFYDFTENGSMNYNSLIDDMSANVDFDWMPAPQHDVKFGSSYVYHTFKPGIISRQSKSSDKFDDSNNTNVKQHVGDTPLYSNEAALYGEDNWTITPWLKGNIGFRTSLYSISGKTYISAEPRLSTRMLITKKFSFKASYSEMSQYIHLLCNSNLSLPSDLWVPVTKNIKPMKSRQGAAGFFYDRGLFEYSAEAYLKTMDNVLEYKDGASYFGTSTGWEEKVCMGRGWSYGLEIMIQKKLGKTTGWVGYTLAKSMRQFDRPGMVINDGNPFPAKYDRRHDLSATVSHKFSEKFDLSATFVYASGNCGSLAMEDFNDNNIKDTGDETDFESRWGSVSYLDKRNNYRMPSYNRMDLGMNFYKPKKHGTAIWNISVYNVYNRLNPFIVMVGTHYKDHPDGTYESWPSLKKLSIFPILPSFSYTYKF